MGGDETAAAKRQASFEHGTMIAQETTASRGTLHNNHESALWIIRINNNKVINKIK